MRQAAGGQVQRKSVNGPSDYPVRCIDGGWDLMRIGDPRRVRSRRYLGDEG